MASREVAEHRQLRPWTCVENQDRAPLDPTFVPTLCIGFNGSDLAILGPLGGWCFESDRPLGVNERLSPGVRDWPISARLLLRARVARADVPDGPSAS